MFFCLGPLPIHPVILVHDAHDHLESNAISFAAMLSNVASPELVKGSKSQRIQGGPMHARGDMCHLRPGRGDLNWRPVLDSADQREFRPWPPRTVCSALASCLV